MKANMIEKKCPVCEVMTSEQKAFCKNCRYPLHVKKMGEFTDKDKKIAISALLHVLHKKKPLEKTPFESKEMEELYNELFSVYWLRPETAVWSSSKLG